MKPNLLRTLFGMATLLISFAVQISANQPDILKTTVEGLNPTGYAREF